DVPCSNTGVIQRRVDVRWRLSPHEIERITELQLSILENAAQAVKQGGRLVYSTCSIETEEDSGLIARFLARHPDFKLDREHLALPCREKADGAYAALLIRA
ncbi:MAG: RNA methyltransferase, partial [Akkermansia sp.]